MAEQRETRAREVKEAADKVAEDARAAAAPPPEVEAPEPEVEASAAESAVPVASDVEVRGGGYSAIMRGSVQKR